MLIYQRVMMGIAGVAMFFLLFMTTARSMIGGHLETIGNKSVPKASPNWGLTMNNRVFLKLHRDLLG